MSCHVCRGGPTWAYAKVRFTGRDARPSALAHAQARARGAHHRASRRGEEEVRVRRPVRPVRGEGGRLDAGGEPRADLPVRSRQLLRGVRLASDLLQGVQREAPGRRGGGVLRAALLLPDEGRRAAPRAGGGGAVLLRRARPRPTRSQDGAVVMSLAPPLINVTESRRLLRGSHRPRPSHFPLSHQQVRDEAEPVARGGRGCVRSFARHKVEGRSSYRPRLVGQRTEQPGVRRRREMRSGRWWCGTTERNAEIAVMLGQEVGEGERDEHRRGRVTRVARRRRARCPKRARSTTAAWPATR